MRHLPWKVVCENDARSGSKEVSVPETAGEPPPPLCPSGSAQVTHDVQ